MIVYEQGGIAAVAFGEQELAGRRVAVRAFPYEGEFGPPRFRFDPIERAFWEREPAGSVLAGPFDSETWRAALTGGPAGAALVGPSDPSEGVRGAFRAAAEGAAASGRAVYLYDPDAEGLPEKPSPVFVAVFVLLPDLPAATRRLAAAAARGFVAGALAPLISGWTDSSEWIEQAVADAASAGARFVAPLWPVSDPAARRRIVEARTAIEPETADSFFDRVHHGGALSAEESARDILVEACKRFGVASWPERARSASEPAANALAARRLEEKAAETQDEHRAALLHAAARWIDELGRDVSVIFRDGNLRKIFPFGADIAGEAEAILADPSDRGARAGTG